MERGLIGPGEVERLWERHLVNSAAVVPYLASAGSVADVGSGAGLPGVVVAAMRPDIEVHLVEPMRRRAQWLREVVTVLGLANARVHEARAQDVAGTLEVDVVTARAVASLDRLVAWTVPLLRPGGRLLLLKGQRAVEELAAAEATLRALGASEWLVHLVDMDGSGETTAVVEVTVAAPVRAGRARPGRKRRKDG